MNIAEGARRMQFAGHRLAAITSGLTVVLVLLFITAGFLNVQMFGPLIALGFLVLFGIIPGAVLWLAGWIVEGFADKRH
jgi:hypothetical protein